ncbi:MAG: hypothetical protein JRG97_00105 [Deltaproteobacteria bacterium]|nr:hypothetical protein [Deltaproteobacteria bacterium]MBW2050649.1 hypothetical protein [Deltaproteobacteria bacterium]MBW2139457.1 hypothetical protein [Deltaproteobacteria bacterium]MBW2324022.1 hypothetical protein [Deltaproteobacteria bacterium]
MNSQTFDSALVLVSPSSGHGEGYRAVPRVERAFRQNGIEARVVLISSPEIVSREIETQAPEASVVVAAGGDGTVNLVARAILLAGQGKPLGLIPFGFGNCLARSLGVPLDIESAVDVIARGQFKTIDIAWTQDRPVMFALSSGFDAEVARKVSEARIGGVSMRDYLRAIWSSVVHYDWPEIKVEVDGRLLKDHYSQVILSPVNNYAIFFQLKSGPGVRVYLFRDHLPRALRYFLLMGPTRNLASASDLSLQVKSSLKMTATQACAPSQIDGEFSGFLPVACEIRPGALQILTP